MVEESRPGTGQASQISRIFEQPPDATSLYSDFAQVIGTENEITLQFYETIPGAPGPGGQVQMVRTRLRVNVVISKAHALNIGQLLITNAAAKPTPAQPGHTQP